MDEHKISIEELYKRTDSSEHGLTSKEADERLYKNGLNVLETKKKGYILLKFLKQFTDFFTSILLIGSILTFVADKISPGEGYNYIAWALFTVVWLNAIFTFIQERQSEKIMESFKKMLPEEVDVLRDGKRQRIDASYLIPGDVIFLQEGEKIPADARLISHNAMRVDHSSLTGESEPQLRKLSCTHDNILESRNMLFSGTLVQSGDGKAIVYATAMNTQIGKIADLTRQTKSVETPLHKEIKNFSRIITILSLSFGFFFFIISYMLGNPLIGSFIFAIGVIVANVPEGLMPLVTLSLSIAAKKMAKKNALIKNLESVETLGSTTVICTDKTGTLTENRMGVNTLIINLEEKNVDEKGIEKLKDFNILLKTMVLCNNSRYDTKKQKYLGDPTDISLVGFAGQYLNTQKLVDKEQRIAESPFDSRKRRMITINKQGNKKIAYIKGAPEVVIQECDRVLINGKIRKITTKDRKIIDTYQIRLASRGERVMGFAFKKTKSDRAKEKDFIFIGLAGLFDPPRKEVPEAIKKCKTAGIRVIMVTGDYGLTAEAVARKVGLVEENATIITGEQLDKMNDKKLKTFLKRDDIIFARTNPIQKLRIVKVLQSMGEIVTVTGDGVNDAPALKNADMGVAMGISGTEVAREASEMVLMDDNFATIVNAVEEGRTVFANIKKFICYVLTSNVPELYPFITYALLKIPLPLTVILMLSIDLGTDLLPAIGLGTEKSESDIMNKKPRSKDEKLLTKPLLIMAYVIMGTIQAAAGFASYFFVLHQGGWVWGQQLAITDPLYMKAITAFFASIVICQVANVLICRTRTRSVFEAGLFKNKVVLLGITAELFILANIIYNPYVNQFFGTHPLSLIELSIAVPFALLIFFGDELIKLLARKGNVFVQKYLSW